MANSIPQFMTINAAAKAGILTEKHLRRLKANDELPGIFVGNRFLINVGLLIKKLNEDSMKEVERHD